MMVRKLWRRDSDRSAIEVTWQRPSLRWGWQMAVGVDVERHGTALHREGTARLLLGPISIGVWWVRWAS